MSRHSVSESSQARLDALRKKHTALDEHIAKQQRDPAATDFYLKQLKRQKLLLKDQITELMAKLRRQSANAC